MKSDTLERLAAAPVELQGLLARLEGAGGVDRPRAPGKWSPRQILAHLADVESVQCVRVMGMLASENPELVAFDADEWAAAGRYASRDAGASAAASAAARSRLVELARSLDDAALSRPGTHPRCGAFTVGSWLEFIVWHDENHLGQLRESLS